MDNHFAIFNTGAMSFVGLGNCTSRPSAVCFALIFPYPRSSTLVIDLRKWGFPLARDFTTNLLFLM